MISCTEFIPAYSELFKFIDQRSGRQAVYDYWDYLFDPESSPLNEYLIKYGLKGCWEYWKVIFKEEACDGAVLFNEAEGWYADCMHFCPSKGRFEKLGYMEPFDEYCLHCNGYDWSLNRHNLVHVVDYRGTEKACCRELIYDPNVFTQDAQKLIDEMYACEMQGCKLAEGKCPLLRPNTETLITSPSTLKYLHREFHVSMDRGADYVKKQYGEEGLKAYLYQFEHAFHVPLRESIKENGLKAIKSYLKQLYAVEEASDALSINDYGDELVVSIDYCPAVRYMKDEGHIPFDTFEKCTTYVYQALAEETGYAFEMLSYDTNEGAAKYRFYRI